MNTPLQSKNSKLAALFIAVLILNTTLFTIINSIGSIFPNGLWVFITNLGDTSIALAIIVAIYKYKDDRGARLLILAIAGTIIIQGLKHLLGVDRPSVVLFGMDGYHLIGQAIKSPSFPSGHTATVFIGAGILAAQYKESWITKTVVAIAALIGTSRIMMGVHWPFDVLVGAALGWIIGFYGYKILMDFDLSADKWKWIGGASILITLLNALTYDLPYAEFGTTVTTERIAVLLSAIGLYRWHKSLTPGSE